MKERKKLTVTKEIREKSPVETVLKDLNLYLQNYLQALRATNPKENLN
jgi:uncharacterized protein (UPF0262 family)